MAVALEQFAVRKTISTAAKSLSQEQGATAVRLDGDHSEQPLVSAP